MQALEARGRAAVEATGALELAEGLARTLGPAYHVSLCRIDPPEILETFGPPRPPSASRDAMVLGSIETSIRESVLNRPAGPGVRLSVLGVPGSAGLADRLALVVEVDVGGLGRAARVLESLVSPGETDGVAAEEHLGGTLERWLTRAEDDVGVPVGEMSRAQKQRVVAYLDARGAFLIKKSVEQVAARLGVSRFTIYNYLDETNGGQGERIDEQR